MKKIIIEETWEQLNAKTNALSEFIKKVKKTLIMMICWYKIPNLHLSEKPLWCMCTNGEITYFKIYGQYFYTIGSIKEMLDANAVQISNNRVQELMTKGRGYEN